MIDAAERAAMEETVRAALAARRRARGGRRRPRRSSAGSRCSTTSRPTRSTSCSARSAPRTRTATALDDVVASALGSKPRADLAVLLPPLRRVGSAGNARARRAPGARPRDGARRRGGRAARRLRHGVGAVGRHGPDAAAEVRAVRGIDPDGGWHEVRVEGSAARRTRLDPDAWQSAVALGRRAVAHQIAGAQPRHARPRAHARARARAVRPPDRAVPGRAPPARRRARRGRGARGDARRGAGRAEPRHRGAREGASRAARRARWPPTASRCSPASASPPSTRSTAS